jgi:hypothetical protein
MGEIEALRARVAELEAQLAAQPYIPALPTERDGEPIEWRPWEPAPVILCARNADMNGCDKCDHPGPQMLAVGLAGNPQLIRFNAHRCPSCQEMRVYQRVYERCRVGARLEEIAYSAPRTIARTSSGEAS